MAKYRKMIATCEAEVNDLHKKLWEAVEHREKSPNQREQWIRAAKAFREHSSPLYDLVDECLKSGLLHNPDLREFVFDYIDQDPYFFRSGYMLESLLQRVKKLPLTKSEKTSIQLLVLKRIETRALRNFRHICRLIHMADSNGFHSEISNRAKSSDPQVKRRAEFALDYFPINGCQRGDGFILR